MSQVRIQSNSRDQGKEEVGRSMLLPSYIVER